MVWDRVAMRLVRPWLSTTPRASRSSRLIAASSASFSAWSMVISCPKLVSAQPLPIVELVEGEADDHLGRGAGVQQFGAPDCQAGELFEGIVHPLSVAAWVRAGVVAGPGCGSGRQPGKQLGAAGRGEPAGGGVAAVGVGQQGEPAAALLLSVRGQDAVGVQVSQNPLAEQAYLAGS